ncbi:hypothetical protein F5Y05DRAFT_286578 [Hypoxylon sp. FL0543]|nr:hypothetical protein F5Y05DRAFT_286578 [Hypoxylon sp. FL0543]
MACRDFQSRSSKSRGQTCTIVSRTRRDSQTAQRSHDHYDGTYRRFPEDHMRHKGRRLLGSISGGSIGKDVQQSGISNDNAWYESREMDILCRHPLCSLTGTYDAAAATFLGSGALIPNRREQAFSSFFCEPAFLGFFTVPRLVVHHGREPNRFERDETTREWRGPILMYRATQVEAALDYVPATNCGADPVKDTMLIPSKAKSSPT